MRRLFLILAFVIVSLAPVQSATANDLGASTTLQTIAMFAPSKPAEAVRGSLLKIQSYDCRACRRGCYRDFKLDCEESEGWCRRQFTSCMRNCWEDECR